MFAFFVGFVFCHRHHGTPLPSPSYSSIISCHKPDINDGCLDVMGCWTEAPPARGACYVQQERAKLIEEQQHNRERQGSEAPQNRGTQLNLGARGGI